MPGRSQCGVCAEERDERRDRKSIVAKLRAAATAIAVDEASLTDAMADGAFVDPEREAA